MKRFLIFLLITTGAALVAFFSLTMPPYFGFTRIAANNVNVNSCAISANERNASDRIIAWGLKPNTDERTPTPPDGAVTLLKQYDGLFVVGTGKDSTVVNGNAATPYEKRVYLTFDLGYEAGHTARVLDILKSNGIRAVFFICGNYLQNTDLVNRMIAEGHLIGNHTDRHRDLPTLSDEAITTDIMTLQNNFIAKFPHAAAPVFFRPPQGRFNERVLRIARDNGLRTMLWSGAIVDWGKTPIDAETGAAKIASRIHPGAVILSHITNSGTPKMLELLIPRLVEKGYAVGNVDEI